MASQIPRYEVLRREGPIEIRRYAAYIQAETFVETSTDPRAAAREGFQRLASYIAGENRARREVAGSCPMLQSRNLPPRGVKLPMTAPVNLTDRPDGVLVAFIMPAGQTLISLPEPSNPRITLRPVPERTVAALRYPGSWQGLRFARKAGRLAAWLQGQGLEPCGDAVFARYNPPYVPGLFRRNEVLIPITSPSP